MARAMQAQARERAREARRRVDAERAEHDRKVDEEVARYFAGQLDLEAAEAELKKRIEAAQLEMNAAIVELTTGLGESAAVVASLIGISAKEVNRIRRLTDTPVTQSTPATDG